MNATFAAVCRSLRRQHAIDCFRKAVSYNHLAHSTRLFPRSRLYKEKARYLDQAVALWPPAFGVDNFELRRGGLVGITCYGVGRLHVPLGSLSESTRTWVWNEICEQHASEYGRAA